MKTFKIALGILVIVVGIYTILTISPLTFMFWCLVGLIINNSN